MRGMRTVLALVCVVALVLWWDTTKVPESEQAVVPEAHSPEGPATEEAELERDKPAPTDEERARAEAIYADILLTAEPRPRADFTIQLVLPDRKPITAAKVKATLIDGRGEKRVAVRFDTSEVLFDRIDPGECSLTVEVSGYRHPPETFVVPEGESNERVTLWPDRWIPVYVHTADGRPFVKLAEDRGLEPKRLFVHAFEVVATSDDQAPGSPNEPTIATWFPAPGYQNVQLPGSIAGSLRVHTSAPFWVALRVHGIDGPRQLVQPDITELRFTIDDDTLNAGLCTVYLRTVDRDSGAEAVDSVVTLKADTSAHRRADLSEQPVGSDGRLRLTHVVPGQHELTVKRGANLVQRRIVLSPAEVRDIGDLAIGSGPGVPLEVVDANGKFVMAWVEIAPYVKGKSSFELYPPNLHQHTDGQGPFELPAPEASSIVRVRLIDGHFGHSEIASGNHLLDPQALPAKLVIVAQESVQVKAIPSSTGTEEDRWLVYDSLDLVVDIDGGTGDLWFDLMPGEYTVKRLRADEELGSGRIRIEAGMTEVSVP